MDGIIAAFAIGFFLGILCLYGMEEMRIRDSGKRKPRKETVIDTDWR